MAALTIDVILARVDALLQRTPFGFTPSPDPFSFDRVPDGLVDRSFCLETESVSARGGMSYSETRVDRLVISIARVHESQPVACYRALLADCSSVTAALVRDGAELGGDYDVLDEGRGSVIAQNPGTAFSLLRLTLPVDYEAQL